MGFVLAPAIEALVGSLRRGSRRMGEMGEIVFLIILGIGVFWLYYRMYVMGPEYLLPPEWRNHHRF